MARRELQPSDLPALNAAVTALDEKAKAAATSLQASLQEGLTTPGAALETMRNLYEQETALLGQTLIDLTTPSLS